MLNYNLDLFTNINYELINDYYNYQNSVKIIIRQLKNDILVNSTCQIWQHSNLITSKYDSIMYGKNTTYIDKDIKKAFRHFVIQYPCDYLNFYINKEYKNINKQDLALMNNISMLNIFTSQPSIDLFNVKTNLYEKVQSTLISDKKLMGTINSQFLSPLTKLFFTRKWEQEWRWFSEVEKYKQYIEYHQNFFLNLISNAPQYSEILWEKKLYSNNYKDKLELMNTFTDIAKMNYDLHNSEFSTVINKNSFETFEILYDINISYDLINYKYNIKFDTLFLSKEELVKFLKDLKLNYNIKAEKFEYFYEVLQTYKNNELIFELPKNCIMGNSLNFNDFNNNQEKKVFFFLISFFQELEKKQIDKNFIDNEQVKNDLKSFFENCINNKINLYLIEINFDIDEKKIDKIIFKNNWIDFFFFIPQTETINNKNYIILCTEKNLEESFKDIKNIKLYFNNNKEIITFFLNLLNFNKINYNNIIIKWKLKHQDKIGEFLDSICGGLIIFLPNNWNGF